MGINIQEMQEVSKLTPEKRFEYLIKRIADFEELWVLHNDEEGFALNEEKNGKQYFMIWPFKEFAEIWATDEFSSFSPKDINVYEFKDKILPKLKNNKIDLLIFPVENGYGIKMNIDDFNKKLNEELSQYE